MIIQRKIMPGQRGTKNLTEKYGDQLVCVRYRYDKEKQERMKTVELIVEKKHWLPNPDRIPLNKKMHVRIHYGEINLGRLVKAAGGQWNKAQKVWILPYGQIKALGLEKRIVKKPP
jgi:hypothetical protein